MIAGVSFNGLHCTDDLGMILAHKEIGLPEVQTTYIDVPGRNGSLDLSEALSGEPRYNDREITLTFITCEHISNEKWPGFLSKVANAVHGKKANIVFDDDPEWTYIGRCAIDEFRTENAKQTVVIVCTCEPFKTNSSGETSL